MRQLPIMCTKPADADSPQTATLRDRLAATAQWLLPTRALSHGMHCLAGSRQGWLKNLLIGLFNRLYDIDLSEARIGNARDFDSFNAFFTRALKADARPLPDDPHALACPVDGSLGAHGDIEADRLFQAKGAAYELANLLQDEHMAEHFKHGSYATLYLAPHNYHRVHMPIDGTLRATRYVPGRLFGVNPTSVRAIPRLFTRNERLVCLFDTAVGPIAMIMVSAFCVGGIETVWSGTVSPPHRSRIDRQQFATTETERVHLQRGDEMGRFNLGSTVIVLFGQQAIHWHEQISDHGSMQMGTTLAHITGNDDEPVP